jgi:hypothetical protein
VRELWAEEIVNDSVVDGSFDSGDLIAAQGVCQKRKLTSLTTRPSWLSSRRVPRKRRKTAADVLMLAEREATSEELDALHGLVDIADIAVKAKAMLDGVMLSLSRDTGVNLDEGESLCTIPETDDEPPPFVDEGQGLRERLQA